jgi:hypothetical protein
MSQPAERLPAAGIIPGISNKDYHADKSTFSSTLIKKMDVPATAKHYMTEPQEHKEAYRIGSAIHKFILEPHDFEAEFLTGIDCKRRSNADKEEWASWFYEHGADGSHIVSHSAAVWNGMFEKETGKHMVTPDEIDKIAAMAQAVEANKNAFKLLQAGAPEQSVYWQDEETGLNLRCRPDYLNSFCSDLKSCQSARPGAVSRDMYKLGYHISAAHYTAGLLAATGRYHPFLFIFIEKTAPYLVAVYGLDDQSQAIAHDEYRRLLQRLADCLETDTWPGLEDNLNLSLPSYAFKD